MSGQSIASEVDASLSFVHLFVAMLSALNLGMMRDLTKRRAEEEEAECAGGREETFNAVDAEEEGTKDEGNAETADEEESEKGCCV